ncbi:type I-D CRISPR-associated protein Cas7/Csc2 [Candidatus Chloroploca sp. Khr17]|uniref:type I-D CRISPR-associated protein Cas7/Csc2 n=1 Tax=Candidatus Chloroploca sp. Khr17 TaxID=2496869 RepID=UPI00101DCD5B|nr:type I-D CRISPR-associated protein Cas7/Csc2 [Candidatus Chloroploca sp. Khr17]
MNTLNRYADHLLQSYSNSPRGKYVSLLIVRRVESEAIFRTEGSGEPLNKEFVHAGGNADSPVVQRVVISKRKQTAVERRTGRELLRRFDLLFATKDGVCSLNTNNPCEKCMDCMIYGYAAGGGGAQRSRIITDDAFSLHPAQLITDTKMFNAPFDNSTPYSEQGKRMTGLGSDEYVRPESLFLDIETMRDLTPGEFRYALGNVLRSTRYGAISSRIGKVRNLLVGIAFSDCELFSNLELTQQSYDLLRGGNADLDFPLHDTTAVQAVRDAAQALRKRVLGQVTMLDADTVSSIVAELGDLYGNEETLRNDLRETILSYGRGLPNNA